MSFTLKSYFEAHLVLRAVRLAAEEGPCLTSPERSRNTSNGGPLGGGGLDPTHMELSGRRFLRTPPSMSPLYPGSSVSTAGTAASAELPIHKVCLHLLLHLLI